MEEDLRTVWCGNLPDRVTEEILYELFLQAGPVDRVFLPKNFDGRPKPFAFIKYEHECSAPYAVALFRNTSLFGRKITLNTRNKEMKMPKILKNLLTSDKEDKREPASWKEHKLAKANDTRNCNAHTRSNNIPPQFNPQAHPVTNFDTLLQMGQQMMFPGIGNFPSVGGFPHMMVPGFPPSLNPMMNNFNGEKDNMVYPSQMDGTGFLGGQPNSYEHSVRENHSDQRNRHRANERGTHHSSEWDNRHHDRDRKSRNNTRPYDLADHRNRDRKYSSSHTLGHRERR